VIERAEQIGIGRLQAWLRSDQGEGAPLTWLTTGQYDRFESELEKLSTGNIVILRSSDSA
jgi:hypothetical protein